MYLINTLVVSEPMLIQECSFICYFFGSTERLYWHVGPDWGRETHTPRWGVPRPHAPTAHQGRREVAQEDQKENKE